jgi:hypothetical protein
MRLVVVETGHAAECDWVLCTSLRDNVQHHLEGGHPGGTFLSIHALADRCWAGSEVQISAVDLADELRQVRPLLAALGVDRLAISIRSRAALTGAPAAPAVRGTILWRLTGWQLPVTLEGARSVGEVFAGLFDGLLAFCDAAGTVEVSVEPPRASVRQPERDVVAIS